MEENTTITNATYVTGVEGENCAISCNFNDVFLCVPMDSGNIHYAEILKQVAAGTLTIADAD